MSGLNKEQAEAVNTLEGPVLILAGAGSGKTRALTCRAAKLIEGGVRAENILALTFTNKAAREMKERISKLIGQDAADEAWISTFHSTCARMLRRDAEKIGYARSFAIYDDDDQGNVIKEILKKLNIDDKYLPVREIKNKISDAKNKMMSPDEWFAKTERDYRNQRIHDVMVAYESRMKELNAMDFDDLLMKTLELFVNHPPVLEYYQRRFQYVMVDEYQDTNRAQYEMVRLMTQKHHNLCVVGDDDQSIYGWRGADIRNILDFEKDYPEAKVIRLEQNYRSTAVILDAANQVIARNAERKDKKLWTENGDGEKIRVFTAEDERDEAAWIADRIKRECEAGETAVLYRTNAQSRVIEEMFMRANIPYKVFGGQKFYERKEIKDIIAYMRVIANPCDDISLRRIINVPKRAIGESTVREMQSYAEKNGMPLYSAMGDLPESLGSRARKSVSEFYEMMTLLGAMKETMGLSEFAQELIRLTGLREQYAREDSEEAAARVGNMDEFLGAVNEYAEMAEGATLEGYLENVSLVTDLDREGDGRNYVTMMTLHAAKGLEFENVFIAGMEENIFPSARSVDSENRLEEERRLMYVGITRAKKRLFLSRARERMIYNQMSFNPESRFLDEIPARLKEEIGAARRFGQTGSTVKSFRGKTGTEENRVRDFGKPKLTLGGKSIGKVKIDEIPGVSKGFVPSKARETEALSQLFQVGDRVLHRKFGAGEVKSIRGSGADARIEIEFSAYGVKEFAMSIAPIIKLEE